MTRHGVEYYFYYVVTLWYFNLSFYVEGIKRKNCFYLIVYTPIYLVCSETDTFESKWNIVTSDLRYIDLYARMLTRH